MTKDSIHLVKEFHETFGHLVADKPTFPSAETINFRISFFTEELQELVDAVKCGDLVGVADALGDVQYVLDGFILECGMHKHKAAILAEIHRSNMSKVCKTEEEAKQTCDYIFYEKTTPCFYEKQGDVWVVKRSEDGKVMKSINYFKPDLKRVLEEGE